jgi:hypothetical protein
MQIKDITASEATVILTNDELAFIRSAIGEAIEAVEEWEFPIRTSWTHEQAWKIQKQFGSLYDKTKKQA